FSAGRVITVCVLPLPPGPITPDTVLRGPQISMPRPEHAVADTHTLFAYLLAPGFEFFGKSGLPAFPMTSATTPARRLVLRLRKGGWFTVSAVRLKMYPAGEAEACSAGEQLAKE